MTKAKDKATLEEVKSQVLTHLAAKGPTPLIDLYYGNLFADLAFETFSQQEEFARQAVKELASEGKVMRGMSGPHLAVQLGSEE